MDQSELSDQSGNNEESPTQKIEGSEEFPQDSGNLDVGTAETGTETSNKSIGDTDNASDVPEIPQTASAPVDNSAEKDKLQSLCTDMFSKMSIYLQGEVDSTVDDYVLLEKMNVATTEKYEVMNQMAKNVGDNLRQLNQKFSDLQPYLDQIEQIESSVLSLEQAAYKLDMYSKRLEERFKQIDKQ